MATQAITEVSSVAHIDGVAKVRLPDGSLKELKVGDTLQPGMVVILDDGAQLTLKDDAIQLGQGESGQAVPNDVAPADNALSSDIAQLQQSILVGADPTQAFEAAAAGAAVDAGIGAGSGNSGFVSINRSGDATIAEAGYDTTTVVSSTSDLSAAEPVTASTSEVDSTPPSITVDAPALTNDRTPTITGTTDLPVGSTISLTVTDSVGVQQTFTTTVQTGGAYSVDVPSELAEGNYSVTATATDVAGNSASATDSGGLDVNDGSVQISGSDARGGVTEDATNPILSDSGRLLISDADGSDEAQFVAGSGVASAGALGSLTIQADGSWTYNVANSAVQYLGQDESKLETFVVKSVDGTEHTVSITIVGVNDGSVQITGSDARGGVTEDATTPILSDSGRLLISDADGSDEAQFVAGSGVASAGALGSLTIQADGSWTYNVANSAVQYLGQDESKLETFVVKSVDGTEHTVSITIVGVNDGSVQITGSDARGGVTEDATTPILSDSGRLLISDADGSDEAQFVAGSGVASAGALGSLTIQADGSWTYNVANSAVQYLGQDESKLETFVVKSVDGTEHTVSITIVGVNDGSVQITGSDARGGVTEDATTPILSDSGRLLISDADGSDEAQFVAGSGVASAGALGSLTIQADGSWTYNVANSAVQYLGQDESKLETFVVKSVDGTEHTVSITIVGVNDGSVQITGSDARGGVTEDATTPILSDSGRLLISDADGSDEAQFVAGSGVASAGALGSLTIQADGSWTYNVANSAVQYLGQDESKLETFVVKSVDGTEHTVSITIVGVNDGSVQISGSDARGGVTEDATTPILSDSGRLLISDADGSDEAQFVAGSGVASAGALGSLTIQADGSWTYNVANSAVQYLGQDESKLETFVVKSVDGTEHTVSITIVGVNDGSVQITGSDARGGVTEDATTPILSDSGRLLISDADGSDEAQFVAGSGVASAGALGSLTIQADGSWTYNVANSAVQYLGQDESKLETFVVKSVDGTEHTVSITIVGVNDGSVQITGSDARGGVTEDATTPTLSDSGRLLISDADGSDEAQFVAGSGVASAGALGSLTIQADGSWTYNVANSAVQYLGQDESKLETFVVKSVDGTEHTVSITIVGVNDGSVQITGSDARGGVTEDATTPILSDSGRLLISDADGSDEAQFVAGSGVASAGALGSLTIQADGSWTYNVANSAVQYLGQDESKLETFVVKSVDGTEHTVSITINGTNDAPTIGTPQITVSVSEEGLSGGIIDTTGNPDSTDATGSLGNLVFNDIDSTKLSVSLTAPTETLTSGGQSIIWTSSTDSSGNALLVGHIGSATGAAVLTVTCDTAGHYTVSLEKPIDHAYQGEDVKSLTIGISVSDSSETTRGSLVVNVEDDAPLASNSTQTIYVASDVISVNDLKAGFINDTYLNNTSSVTRTNTDSDSYNDSLRWGTAAVSGGSKSGYNLVDNSTYSSSAGSAVTAGTAFKVGDFTHINYAINSDSSTLSSTDMTMSMDVVINGVSTAVSFVVHITHTETPNSSDALASRDIITLPAQTVSVEIDGQDYQVNLLGFKDSSGNVVNTIYTNEDTSNNTFGIYASVTSTADLPQVTGDILTQSGADGAYLYSVAVNGVTYAYNPANGGSVSTSGGTSKGVFDTTTNSLTITTTLGGKFVVNLDSGEYVYTAPATVVSTTAENIAYIIKDNDGDTANAALTINVTAPSVTTLTSTTTSAANMGLSGEYYGYNETTSPQAKNYNVQTGDGAKGNIDNISETIAIIDAKQGVTTSIIGIGTSNPEKASESATDAVFVATTLNYGGVTSGNLGYNSSNVEVSDANTPKVLTAATGDNLFVFLNKGSSSGDANSLVATSSYGNTTDAIVRMLGEVYLTGGSYKFKVTADDGYSIYVDGRQIFAYDANTSSKESISSSIAISEGLHNIEIVYWDQGGAANFSMSYSLDGGATYLGFNSTNLALFQDNKAPTLSELQDLVSVNGSWVVRTGSDFTGTSGNDNVTGSDGRDHIRGGDGNDVLSGGSGSDKLEGGTGNDYLIGSLGDDILIGGDGDDHLYGGLGNDTMTGGTGVDRFVWNANDQGTTGAPAIDHITDFSKTSDIIDIRDLLDTNGDKTLTALKAYLSVSTDSNSNITIEVHQGNTGLSTDITNKIVLDGVHYSDFGSGATATTILNTLVDSQHLLIDKS